MDGIFSLPCWEYEPTLWELHELNKQRHIKEWRQTWQNVEIMPLLCPGCPTLVRKLCYKHAGCRAWGKLVGCVCSLYILYFTTSDKYAEYICTNAHTHTTCTSCIMSCSTGGKVQRYQCILFLSNYCHHPSFFELQLSRDTLGLQNHTGDCTASLEYWETTGFSASLVYKEHCETLHPLSCQPIQ